jgi:hypothetical protein
VAGHRQYQVAHSQTAECRLTLRSSGPTRAGRSAQTLADTEMTSKPPADVGDLVATAIGAVVDAGALAGATALVWRD